MLKMKLRITDVKVEVRTGAAFLSKPSPGKPQSSLD